MADVEERDGQTVYSFGGTIHHWKEPNDQCCLTRDKGTKDRIREIAPI